MPQSDQPDFQRELAEILDIPGIKQNMVAEWAGVDPSTVTRWVQGKTPSDPTEVLRQLKPHVDRERERVASVRQTEVDSWGPLYSSLSPGIRDYVDLTGLMASTYWVIAASIPSSKNSTDSDVVILRYFDGVWADMSRRIYNVGDQSQIVSLSTDGDPPEFNQEQPLGDIVGIDVKIDKEVGRSVARLLIRLSLEKFPYANESIGFIDSFGYRFRATKAIASKRAYQEQTNDFLGAVIPIPCHRFKLIACIPTSCLRGSPSALVSSNRSMLKVLMELDNAKADVIESLLWPRGQRYEMSSVPDAPLRPLAHVDGTIDSMPSRLQEHLGQPADLDARDGESIREVLCRKDSASFLLDLHAPHPSLTANIVWRLPRFEPKMES